MADSENTSQDKLLSEDLLPNEPGAATSSNNDSNTDQLVSSEPQLSMCHDQIEPPASGSPDNTESTGAEDRKKRGRRNKFK